MKHFLIAMLISIIMVGCEIPQSRWDAKSVVSEIMSGDDGECRFDGFDAICLIPQPVEVVIEVPVEVEKRVEVIKEVIVEVPSQPEVVEVVTEVEVSTDKIVEVVKYITEVVEVPVEVIRIVEVPVETIKAIEVPVEVEVEVPVETIIEKKIIVEVEKIIEVPVEVIRTVEVPIRVEVPGEVVIKEILFTGKVPIPSGYIAGSGACSGSCHAVIEDGFYQYTEFVDADGTVYRN